MTKQQPQTDDLTIPSFLRRKSWTKKQHAEHEAALARHPVTILETAQKRAESTADRKARESLGAQVEAALRRMPFEQQELTAREVLPLFAQTASLDELRLMLDDRMPGAIKDDEEGNDDRLRGAERERVAQEVVAAVGQTEPTLHELRKRLPAMDDKTLRSGLRRALALSILFQRKDGGRYVYSTASGRKAMKAAQATTPGQEPVKERAPRKPREAGGASKKDIIGQLLLRPEGCTTKDVLAATGWPAVSMPAQAKVVGLTLRKEKLPGQETRYYGSK